MRTLTVLLALLLSGCTAYDGYSLHKGSETLSYPRGPMGQHTFMADISPHGILQNIHQVLVAKNFDKIIPKQSIQAEVRRLLGKPAYETYFPLPNEMVWDYFYDDMGLPWVIRIGFDPSGTVTDSIRMPDYRYDEPMFK